MKSLRYKHTTRILLISWATSILVWPCLALLNRLFNIGAHGMSIQIGNVDISNLTLLGYFLFIIAFPITTIITTVLLVLVPGIRNPSFKQKSVTFRVLRITGWVLLAALYGFLGFLFAEYSGFFLATSLMDALGNSTPSSSYF